MIVRVAILQEAVTRLEAAQIASEVELMPSSDPTPGRALHVHDMGQIVVEGEADARRYRLTFMVEGFATGETASQTHRALNDLYAGTMLALFASDDGQALNGLAEQIEDGEMRVMAAHHVSELTQSFSQEFFVFFTTRRGDPTRAG